MGMKYIVWELISPYDGYGTTEHATWDEACAQVKRIVDESPRCKRNGGSILYKNWLAGKIDIIETGEVYLFVTSARLTGPLPE